MCRDSEKCACATCRPMSGCQCTSSMANSCGTHAHRQVNLEASEAAVDPTVSDSDSCRGLGVHWALRVIYVTAPNHRGVVAPSRAIDKGSCTGANGVGSYAH